MFGGLLPNFGPTNQLQGADQISWQHGKHSIRAGYEYEWTNWPLLDSGLQQGLRSLGTNALLAAGGNAGPFWNVGCLFCVKSIPGDPTVGISPLLRGAQPERVRAGRLEAKFATYDQRGLALGVRRATERQLGRLTQVWLNRMAPNTHDAFTTPPDLP